MHQYRITKYDPRFRDKSGAYTRDEWTEFTDIGEIFGGVRLTLPTYLDVEANYLVAVASFLEESGTVTIRAEGVENANRSFRVTEGDVLSPIDAVEAIRQMLRDEGWCRLVDDDRFYVHVGWDYYMYVGSDQHCDQSVQLAESRGLFVDRDFPSPHLD